MKTSLRSSVMLAAMLGLAILSGTGQTTGTGSTAKPSVTDKFDLGLTYVPRRATAKAPTRTAPSGRLCR
jgi:hypothetical protein